MSNYANRAHSLSLSGGIAARALPTCARPAALVRVGPYAMEPHCASGTAVSLGARPCSDVPAAAFKRAAYLRTCASQTEQTAHALSLSLSGGIAACALPTCARPAALVGVGPCPMEAHCASRTAVSLGALPCSDVLALALTSREVGCACSALARTCALSLSGGSAARALATCARADALVGVGLYPKETHRARETAVFFGARPCSDVPAAAPKREAYLRTCASQK